MRLPVLAIVGRPNVGKSTFINRLVGSREAIVDDLPGVTRDRAYYEAEWQNVHFTVIDTGGLVPDSAELFAQKINEQVEVALIEADVILFVLDAQAGLTALDTEIAKSLRGQHKPVFVIANKVDTIHQTGYASEFYALGLGDPHALSAMHGSGGVGDLLDKLCQTFEQLGFDVTPAESTKKVAVRLAFVGRPNVGKSSIVNRLVGQERTIVSDVPGTTRDAIDITLTHQDRPCVLVDTAGIRKKGKVTYGVETFSVDRAIRALRKADVTVLVIDATEGITDQDKRIIKTSCEAGRGLLLVVNKWDLIPEKSTTSGKSMSDAFYREIPYATYIPMVFVSAKTGQRVDKILEKAFEVYENNHRRIQTSLVNQILMDAYALSPPPMVKNKRLKIYYATQVSAAPPTFLLFVNSDTLLKEAYRRYLEHRLRQNIEFTGAPIVLACRNKPKRED